MSAVETLSQTMPLTQACAALGMARATLYRTRQGAARPKTEPTTRMPSALAIGEDERATIRALLNSPEYMDKPPRAVYANLLDQGKYLCSWRTMYRVLAEHGEIRERRAVRPPHSYVRPELVATAPRRVWSWDITKLKGLIKGQFFYFYVILDIFSRYVVGWMVAEREGEDLARLLVTQTAAKEGIDPGSLILHADRGSAMTAGSMGDLLLFLGIAKSHSRPRVSNDNPYSESQFKTLKYRPAYPGRFRDLDHALEWAAETVSWYNHEHCHIALALLTPAVVHAGQAESVLAKRQAVLDQAFGTHPQRFPAGRPIAGSLPERVWINEPALDLQTGPLVSPVAPPAQLPINPLAGHPTADLTTLIPEPTVLH